MKKVSNTQLLKFLVSTLVFIWGFYIFTTTKQQLDRIQNELTATNLMFELTKEFKDEVNVNNMSNIKIILLWNRFYDHKVFVFPPFEPCEYKCFHTNDRRYLPYASLVVFHVGNVTADDLLFDNPVAKAYLAIESPMYAIFYKGSPPPNYFNYSMTYRDDSDVTIMYDQPRSAYEKKTDQELDQIIKKKNQFAVSARSNCKTISQREKLIDELENHVDLTLVGRCTNVTCDTTCLDEHIENHYFYLSFENSICDQYTTEKFFRFTKFIVPIVLKRSVVPKRIPHDIFIAVDDFNNVIELVNYLKMLVRTPKEYKKYFEWAKHDPLTDTYSKKVLDAACTSCKLAHELPPKQIPDYSKILDRDLCDNDFLNRFLNTTSSSAI